MSNVRLPERITPTTQHTPSTIAQYRPRILLTAMPNIRQVDTDAQTAVFPVCFENPPVMVHAECVWLKFSITPTYIRS